MAFAVIEDPTGEIEAIIFPKQYELYAQYVKTGRGVYIEGEVSIKEGEAAKITVNKLTPLMSNEEYAMQPPPAVKTPKPKAETLYIRVPSVESGVTKTILRILKCVEGTTPVVLFDEQTKKYLSATGYSVRADEKLIGDLRRILGNDSVILR